MPLELRWELDSRSKTLCASLDRCENVRRDRKRQHILDDDEVWYGMKDIIVTTYECIVSTDEFFHRHSWSALVLDEAHRIKNEGSRVREAIDALECSKRILLTGTPCKTIWEELFSLLRFLFGRAVQMPGVFFNGQGSTMDTVVDTPLMESIRFRRVDVAKHCQEDPLAQCVDPLQDMLLKALQCMLARLSKLGVFVVSAGFPSRCGNETFRCLDCRAPRCEVPGRDVDDKASRRDL